jgi:hypothetical protein
MKRLIYVINLKLGFKLVLFFNEELMRYKSYFVMTEETDEVIFKFLKDSNRIEDVQIFPGVTLYILEELSFNGYNPSRVMLSLLESLIKSYEYEVDGLFYRVKFEVANSEVQSRNREFNVRLKEMSESDIESLKVRKRTSLSQLISELKSGKRHIEEFDCDEMLSSEIGENAIDALKQDFIRRSTPGSNLN